MCSLPPVVAMVVAMLAAPGPDPGRITEDEVRRYLIERLWDCGDHPTIYSVALDHADFDGDGVDEAIVVASTCLSGTGGPDVHSVLQRGADGKLHPLDIDYPKTFRGRPLAAGLVGNRNHDLSAGGSPAAPRLVERWRDSSGRDEPLVVTYRWDAGRFVIEDVRWAPMAQPSFDCLRASNDAERMVCASAELAAMDVRLDSLYRAVVRGLTGAERERFRAEQREWIATRDRMCTYRDVTQCLRAAYQSRLDALDRRLRGR